MIITKTPYRVSLMGGGTDLRKFYQEGYGAVVSTAIDQFIYIAIHRFFEPKIVLKYSRTEVVNEPSEIEHPLIRECFAACGTGGPLEMTSFADIPATGSGLGSSSAFCVGLVKALHAFAGKETSPHLAAEMACDVEIERLGEPIGKQDQYAAAFGGFNYIRFSADGSVLVEPILLGAEKRETLQNHLVMFYTGLTRSAREVLTEQNKNLSNKEQMENLRTMRDMADTLRQELNSGNIEVLGEMLHESWVLKRQLASGISSGHLDEIYTAARRAGATGGKLLGAGGGGFFLFYCKPEKQMDLSNALKDLRHFPFRFEPFGTRTLYYSE